MGQRAERRTTCAAEGRRGCRSQRDRGGAAQVVLRKALASMPMRSEVVDRIEAFIEEGALWSPDGLQGLIDRLDGETRDTDDPIPQMLSTPLRSILVRMQMGAIPPRVAADIEGVVYPRLWKLMEAARDELPLGEQRVRIEVMNRRLARIFAEET